MSHLLSSRIQWPHHPFYTLDRLPAEISDRICENLHLEHLRALRLTSRRICSASSQEHFTRYFTRRSVLISETPEIQHLIDSVGESEHARKLQHLDLIMPIDPVNMEAIAQNVVATCCALQRNLPGGCLPCLSINLQLRVEIYDWKRTWEVIAGGWQILVRSLATSGLVINEFDAFSKASGSISLDRVYYPLVPSTVLSPCFSRLRNLDISLSYGLEDVIDNSNQSLEKSERYCNSFCDFVNLCPALQHLGLHWYILTYDDETAPLMRQQNLLDYIVRQCPLSNLQSVCLRGIHTSSAVLLRLAEKCQLRSVEMDNVYLRGTDTFRVFFNHITPTLHSVRLSELWEERIIEFDIVHPLSVERISRKLIRQGVSARGPIEYHQSQSIPSGDIEVLQTMRDRRAEYGPPGRGV